MVSFKDAVVICMKDKIFTFKGRAPRSEFWWFMLFDFLASIVLSMLSLIPILGAFVAFVCSVALFI